MKKILMPIVVAVIAFLATPINSISQKATKKVAKTIEAKASDKPNEVVAALNKPGNIKDKPVEKSRGDVYGSNLSDIVVDNYTGYYIDIYVDGSYRGTLAPWDKKVTWAIPGSTTLYAKAVFDDGSYKYWGPTTAQTGYEYKWNLRK